jgi:hypothetical protein
MLSYKLQETRLIIYKEIFISKKTLYQNTKDTYSFDDFNINSSFDSDRVRTITVNSPDIVEGQIVGNISSINWATLLEFNR